MGHKRFNLVGRRWLKVSQSIKFSAPEVIGGKTKSLTLFGLIEFHFETEAKVDFPSACI